MSVRFLHRYIAALKDVLRQGPRHLFLACALLAGNAWAVSTGGAAVLRRIADTVINAMENSA